MGLRKELCKTILTKVWGIFLESGAFHRGRIWAEGTGVLEKDGDKVSFGYIECKGLLRHPNRSGQVTVGWMVLVGNTDLGSFMWIVIKTMDCLNEVTKGECIEGNNRGPKRQSCRV